MSISVTGKIKEQPYLYWMQH